MRGAHDDAGAGDKAAVMPLELGDPKVDQLDGGVVVDEDIGWFDVAMDDADLVDRRQAPRDLGAQQQRGFFVDGPAIDQRRHGLTVDDLQGHPGQAVGLAGGMDADDVLMFHARQGARFAQKAGLGVGVGSLRGEDLERDPPAKALVGGEVDLAHASLAEGGADDVAADDAAHARAGRGGLVRRGLARGA